MATLKLTNDFAKLVQAFELAPDLIKNLVRLQVKMAVRDIKEDARENHKFVTRSGLTEKSIMSRAKDNEGVVMLTSAVARYLHEGTAAHDIVPRHKKVLRFPMANGQGFIFTKRVRHPGIASDPYLYNAADRQEPLIVKRFSTALDELLRGL